MSWLRLAAAGVAGALLIPVSAVAPVVAGQAGEQAVQATAAAKGKRVKAKGALQVVITADSGVLDPDVVIRRPGFRAVLNASRRLSGLRPGVYAIVPRAENRTGGRMSVSLTDDAVRVRAGRTARVRVAFHWRPSGQTGEGAKPLDWESEVIRLTNAARSQRQNCGSEGTFPAVGAVTMSERLTLAARRHAQDMADENYFEHDSLDGRDVGDRISAVGYRWSWWGENIAAGQQSPAEAVQAWLESDGHCANLMNRNFTELGVGFVRGGSYGTYWVQDFARPR